MRTVLMIAFLFPPRASIGAKRPLRFARHLASFGWRPVVLAGPPGVPGESDDSLLAALPPDLRVDRDYAPAWLWRLRNLGESLNRRLRRLDRAEKTEAVVPAATGPAKGGRLAAFVERMGDRFIPIDPNIVFLPHAIRAGRRLVRQERPSAIYVSGYPFSAFLIGMRLKRRFGLPLICELRDPWTLNFQFADRHPLVAALERRIERRVFEAADRIVVTTASLRAAYQRLYPHLPADRIQTIYSSYDEGLAPGGASPPARGPLSIVHFGGFYGARRAGAILRAIARLRDQMGPSGPGIRFTVFGTVKSPADQQLIRELGLEGCVDVRPRLPYAEGLATLRAADVLYLNTFGEETLYIPGKLYDYLLAGRPILCETASPEVKEILQRTGVGASVATGDEDGLLGFLRRALDARTGGAPIAAPVRSEVERFATPAITAELASLLDEITGAAAPAPRLGASVDAGGRAP